jgi:hypothetical protein
VFHSTRRFNLENLREGPDVDGRFFLNNIYPTNLRVNCEANPLSFERYKHHL